MAPEPPSEKWPVQLANEREPVMLLLLLRATLVPMIRVAARARCIFGELYSLRVMYWFRLA